MVESSDCSAVRSTDYHAEGLWFDFTARINGFMKLYHIDENNNGIS